MRCQQTCFRTYYKYFYWILVNGSVVTHSIKNVWEIRINGVKNCRGLFAYFDEYNLITKKAESYSKWKAIHSKLVNGDHFNKITREELIILAKQVNKSI